MEIESDCAKGKKKEDFHEVENQELKPEMERQSTFAETAKEKLDKEGSHKQQLVPYFAKGKGKADERGNQEQELAQLALLFVNLPSHVAAHIMLQLPIKDVLLYRYVCKYWNTLMSSPYFAKSYFERRAPVSFLIRTKDFNRVSRTLHLLECDPGTFENQLIKLVPTFKLPLRDGNSYLEEHDETEKMSKRPRRDAVKLVLEKKKFEIDCKPDYDKYEIVNGCNGLLCLSGPFQEHSIVVCNPVTGDFIRLLDCPPPIKWYDAARLNTRLSIYVGFGFQPKTGEYKVLKALRRLVRDAHYRFGFEGVTAIIQTLGTPTWRNVEVDPMLAFSIDGFRFLTCVNGALHWITSQKSILCFNLESERFQSFPSPPHVFENENDTYRHTSLGELRGFLYLCDASSFNHVTMWVAKEYGIGEPWTKVYSFDTLSTPLGSPHPVHYGLCWPVKHFEEGAAILLYHSANCFIYFEPERCGFKVFRIHGTQSPVVEVIPHTPSLISLKDVVKGDNVEVLNVHSRCAKFKLREEKEVFSLVQDIVFDSATSS